MKRRCAESCPPRRPVPATYCRRLWILVAGPSLAADTGGVRPAPSLPDIRCFSSVARHLSFSRAATELGLSQPAVSQSVKRLERLLGYRLFDRTSREVHLSVAGKALSPHADALLAATADFVTEAERLAVVAQPAIAMAYPSPVGALAARTARRLTRRHPGIDVDLRPAGRQAALDSLARGDVAAAIIGAPFPHGLAVAARFQLRVGHLAVPAADPLATVRRARPDQLRRYRFLLPRRRPPGGMWSRLAAQLRGPHQHRQIAEDIDDFAATLDLVAAGAGLLPVPDLIVATVCRQDIAFIPFDASPGDAAGLRLSYGLVWSRDDPTAQLLALVQTVQETLRSR